MRKFLLPAPPGPALGAQLRTLRCAPPLLRAPPNSQPPDAPELLLPPDALASARLLFANSPALGHDMVGHAECAARVPAIMDALHAAGLTSHPAVAELEGWAPADLSDIAPVHNRRYIAALERSCDNARDVANLIVEPAPTYVTQTTYRDALRAAGAATALVDHVIACDGRAAGFAFARPPGHHAVPANGMGFCLLNNAAVAARHAQRAHGLAKVAIFDWDVHHGNGTQDVFWDDSSVLFVSTHQRGSYPNTGKAGEAGGAGAEGATINVPLPGESGHAAALDAFEQVVGPSITRFDPDIIIVSAGYDAHWRDPLAGLNFRSGTFHELATRVKALADEVCGGRVVFLLEGGYDLGALGESVASTVAALVGGAAIDTADLATLREEPTDKVREVLQEARRIHGL